MSFLVWLDRAGAKDMLTLVLQQMSLTDLANFITLNRKVYNYVQSIIQKKHNCNLTNHCVKCFFEKTKCKSVQVKCLHRLPICQRLTYKGIWSVKYCGRIINQLDPPKFKCCGAVVCQQCFDHNQCQNCLCGWCLKLCTPTQAEFSDVQRDPTQRVYCSKQCLAISKNFWDKYYLPGKCSCGKPSFPIEQKCLTCKRGTCRNTGNLWRWATIPAENKRCNHALELSLAYCCRNCQRLAQYFEYNKSLEDRRKMLSTFVSGQCKQIYSYGLFFDHPCVGKLGVLCKCHFCQNSN